MTMPNPETKVLTGTIRIVGNEPFTHVVLTVGESADQAIGGRDYLIVGPLGEQLRKKHRGKSSQCTVRSALLLCLVSRSASIPPR